MLVFKHRNMIQNMYFGFAFYLVLRMTLEDIRSLRGKQGSKVLRFQKINRANCSQRVRRIRSTTVGIFTALFSEIPISESFQ